MARNTSRRAGRITPSRDLSRYFDATGRQLDELDSELDALFPGGVLPHPVDRDEPVSRSEAEWDGWDR